MAALRYAYDSLSGDQTLAPRFDASVAPFTGRNTVVKAGIGRFHGKLPLNADGFTERQRRLTTDLEGEGPSTLLGAGRSILLENRLDADGLRTPVTTTWNVELDHEIARDLLARVSYRRSSGSQQLVIDSIENEALVLSSTAARARASSRQLSAGGSSRAERSTSRTCDRGRRATSTTTSRSSATFATRSSSRTSTGRQPFDVPNRFLVWGIVHLPYQIMVSPTAEYRDGFPYTIVDESQTVVGKRNSEARYPRLFTLDMAVTKDVRLTKKQRARVGLQFFNLTGHFNPRDVQNNTGSATYGSYANSADRHIRAKFTLLF